MRKKRVWLKKLPPEISDRLAHYLGQPLLRIDMVLLSGGATVGFAQAIGRDARRLGLVAEKRNSG
jgi:hypothetical protein